jgi:hypothetical protein
VKQAVTESVHGDAVLGKWGDEDVALVVAGVYLEVALARAKAARSTDRSAAAAARRREKGKKKQRYGYLYAHGDALARVLKLGCGLAANGQRGLGAGTATFWPRGLGRMTARIDLGECTEAEAAVRLRCYETLVRAVLHKHLVHLRREVCPPLATHPKELRVLCYQAPPRGVTWRGAGGGRWPTSTTASLASAWSCPSPPSPTPRPHTRRP